MGGAKKTKRMNKQTKEHQKENHKYREHMTLVLASGEVGGWVKYMKGIKTYRLKKKSDCVF